MDEIRKVFAKANGVGAGWFSFNSDGGSGGGEIVFEGVPEQIVECESSRTGKF